MFVTEDKHMSEVKSLYCSLVGILDSLIFVRWKKVISRKETGPNCQLLKYVAHMNFSTKIKKAIGF